MFIRERLSVFATELLPEAEVAGQVLRLLTFWEVVEGGPVHDLNLLSAAFILEE